MTDKKAPGSNQQTVGIHQKVEDSYCAAKAKESLKCKPGEASELI